MLMQHAIVCDRATIVRDRAPPEAVQEACTPRRRAQTPAARRGTSTRTRCAPPAACATRGMRRPRRCASRRAAAWRCSSSLPLRTAGRRCRTCGTAAAGCAAERSGRCSASRSCPRGTLVAACFRGARPFPSRGVGFKRISGCPQFQSLGHCALPQSFPSPSSDDLCGHALSDGSRAASAACGRPAAVDCHPSTRGSLGRPRALATGGAAIIYHPHGPGVCTIGFSAGSCGDGGVG